MAAFADDLAELAAACRQLLADGSAGDQRDKVVDKYYGGRVETNAFKVADIALGGSVGNRRSSSSGTPWRPAEAPVPIVAAFARQDPDDGEGQCLPGVERSGGVGARDGAVAGAACAA